MLRAEFIILMRRLQSGDIGALAPLYEEYFQKMYSTVLVMLHSAEDAYDVATAAILKLADYRGDPAKIKNPVGYLIGMSATRQKIFSGAASVRYPPTFLNCLRGMEWRCLRKCFGWMI